MLTFMSQIINRLSKNRIKQIFIFQSILLIPILIIYVYLLVSNSINYFYDGLYQIIFALSFILNGIEHFILKKKGSGIFFFIIGILFVYLSIQSFDLYYLKK